MTLEHLWSTWRSDYVGTLGDAAPTHDLTLFERILAAQLAGTGVIGVAVVLGAARGDAAFLDAALIGTLLAAIAVTAFVRGTAKPGAKE